MNTNLLSLEQFRLQLHYNPYHFWGWQNSKVPVTSQCNTVVKAYSWQTTNAVGRFEIRQAIIEAEKRLRDFLQYSVAPHFVTDDIKDYGRFYDKQWWARYPIDGRGEWKPVTLSEGYVQAVGVESLTKIATVNIVNDTSPTFPYHQTTNPAVPYLVYRDKDGDGLADTFEIGVATSVTDPSQVALYFSQADRLGYNSPVNEDWRINPIQVSISGGILNISGRSWMLGRPILYEGVTASDLDPDVASNYAQSLDVYQRICDPTGDTIDTSQGKFIWETLPYTWWWGIAGSGNNATDPAAQAFSIARVGVRDAKNGIVIPGEAILDTNTGEWNMSMPPWSSMVGRPPDRVTVRYFAGYPLDTDLQMDSKFVTADARLAMAQLDNRIAACDEAQRELYRWQRDMSNVADRTEGYRISNEDLNNPFGPRRGAIDAWKQVQHLRQLRGVSNQ